MTRDFFFPKMGIPCYSSFTNIKVKSYLDMYFITPFIQRGENPRGWELFR